MLSVSQKKAIREHIELRWKSPACTLCGHDDWSIKVVTHLQIMEFGASSTNPSLPCVAITCRYCANTILLNQVLVDAARESLPDH